MNFTIKGQCKSGKNLMQVTRTGHHYPLPAFVEWRSDAEAQIRTQIGFPRPLETPLMAFFSYVPGDLRRRDVPGMVDAVFHVLEHLNLVKDDALIKDVHWLSMPMNREAPRLDVTLEPKN